MCGVRSGLLCQAQPRACFESNWACLWTEYLMGRNRATSVLVACPSAALPGWLELLKLSMSVSRNPATKTENLKSPNLAPYYLGNAAIHSLKTPQDPQAPQNAPPHALDSLAESWRPLQISRTGSAQETRPPPRCPDEPVQQRAAVEAAPGCASELRSQLCACFGFFGGGEGRGCGGGEGSKQGSASFAGGSGVVRGCVLGTC